VTFSRESAVPLSADGIALVHGGRRLPAGALWAAVRTFARSLDNDVCPGGTVGLLLTATSTAQLVAFLGTLAAGRTVAFLPSLPSTALVPDLGLVVHPVRHRALVDRERHRAPRGRSPWRTREVEDEGNAPVGGSDEPKSAPTLTGSVLCGFRAFGRPGSFALRAADLLLGDPFPDLVGAVGTVVVDAWLGDPVAQALVTRTLLAAGTVVISDADSEGVAAAAVGADAVLTDDSRALRTLASAPSRLDLSRIRQVWSTAYPMSETTAQKLRARLPQAEVRELVTDPSGHLLATRTTTAAADAPRTYTLTAAAELTTGPDGRERLDARPRRDQPITDPLWEVKSESNGTGSVALIGRLEDRLMLGAAHIHPAAVESALLDQPGVLDAVVWPTEHPAFGPALACALVLEPGTTAQQVLARARAQARPGQTPASAVEVKSLDRARKVTGAPALQALAHAHKLLREQLTATEAPFAKFRPSLLPRSRTDAWTALRWTASQHSIALEAALTGLLADPEHEARVQRALDRPGTAALPLSLLPDRAAVADSALGAWLALNREASAQLLSAVDRHGWPTLKDGAPAAHAAWRLLLHADHAPERHDLLAEVRRAVETGALEPQHLGWLLDRELIVAGSPQVYGTHVHGGELQGMDPERQSKHRQTLVPGRAWGQGAAWPMQPAAPVVPAMPLRIVPRQPSAPGPLPQADPAPADRIPLYIAGAVHSAAAIGQLARELADDLHPLCRWTGLVPGSRPAAPCDCGPALERLTWRLMIADLAAARIVLAVDDGPRTPALVTAQIAVAVTVGMPVVHVTRASGQPALPGVVPVPDLATALGAIADWTSR